MDGDPSVMIDKDADDPSIVVSPVGITPIGVCKSLYAKPIIT